MKQSSIAYSGENHVLEVRRITVISITINIILFILQFVLGVIGHSQAVIADAIHTLSDFSTDIVVLIGVVFWAKLPDEDHPYGHRRIETMVTTIIGVVLVTVALGIGYRALRTLGEEDIAQPQFIACIGSLITIMLKEGMYHWAVAVGRRQKSSALIASAWHHRSDALSSIPVVVAVGVAAFYPKWAFIDHVGALVVSIFILYASGGILRSTILEILETGVSKKQQKKIQMIALSVDGVKSAHALRTRRVGPGWYADLHIQVDPSMSVKCGHEISEIVQQALLKKGEDIVDVVVHLEPFEENIV